MHTAAFKSLAVGFFDGVHLGHQAILKGAEAALTFRAHPLSVLAPARAPRLLMTCEERVDAIRACGVREVVVLDFTPALAQLSPEAFLAEAAISPQTEIRCGGNWRFGRGGAGDAAYLRARGQSVAVVPSVSYRGEAVSSTRIRAALERGEVADANAMLGRPFATRGRPFAGKGEGKKLGRPTLNLALDALNVRLPLGVYVVEVAGARAVANYGVAPTFGDRAWEKPVLEAHFLSTPLPRLDDAPSGGLAVAFLRYLRPERRFETVAALAGQIARDCAEAAR